MPRLSELELECLRRVAGRRPDSTPCPQEVIERLLFLDLIVVDSALRLPLEAIDVEYRLTERGRLMLEEQDR